MQLSPSADIALGRMIFGPKIVKNGYASKPKTDVIETLYLLDLQNKIINCTNLEVSHYHKLVLNIAWKSITNA